MVMKAAAQTEARTIPAGEFKARCLQLMDEINEKDLALTVTKRGKPVVVITAAKEAEKPFRSIVGRSPNIRVLGDIVSPLPEELTLPAYAWDKPTKAKKGKKK